jgi:hypothetical protein
MGLRWVTSNSIIHASLHKPNNKLVSAKLKHFWCIDEPRANTNSQDSPRPRLEGSYHLPPYSILCAWPWNQDPNVILSQDSHLRFLQLWRPITLCANLQLRWGLEQSRSPCRELSKNMWYATCTQGSQGDSQLLMVGSQIGNLTPSPSFGHNLCFNYPNGSCEPILNIYVPRAFQWYKELFNPMGFNPLQLLSKDWRIHWDSNSQNGRSFGSVEVHSFTLSHTPTLPGAWNVTPELHSWPAPSQALTLVTNPKLWL